MKEKPRSDVSLLKTFSRFLTVNKRYNAGLALCILLTLACSAVTGVRSLLLGRMIDDAGLGVSMLLPTIAAMIAAQIVLFPLNYLSGIKTGSYVQRCAANMREHSFARMADADMSLLERHKAGDLVSRLNADLNGFSDQVSGLLGWVFPQYIMFFVALAISIYTDWRLSLICYTVLPVLGFLQSRTGIPISRYQMKRNAADGRAVAIANNLLGGHIVAKVYNLRAAMREKFDAAVNESVEAGVKSFMMEFIMLPLQSVMIFMPYTLIIGTGVWLISQGTLTVGGLVTFVFISDYVLDPIGNIAWTIRDLYQAAGNTKRVFEVWDFKVERLGGESFPVPNDAAPVVLNDVRYAYEGKSEVLRGMNAAIGRGERVAIVGSSGSGKSTALKLIAAFYAPSGGSLRLFGHDITEWNLDALRKHIALVTQEAYLFPGTIYENVALGREGASEAEVCAAIKRARLNHLDIHAHLGERGVRLSGGERQRVAIARAMLKDAPLLLLDEPTSALDVESERAVMQALEELMRGRTTILIAHRLSALRDVSRIICLKDGIVAQEGTHEELLRADGVYKRLYESQLNNDDSADKAGDGQ